MKEIEDIVSQIKERVSAREIFLFGSYAYGNPTKESDIDLCIVTEENNIRKIDLLREIRRSISSIISKPIDILVYGHEEFNKRSNLKSTIEYKIKSEGLKIG